MFSIAAALTFEQVAVMNSLSCNLHLLLISLYACVKLTTSFFSYFCVFVFGLFDTTTMIDYTVLNVFSFQVQAYRETTQDSNRRFRNFMLYCVDCKPDFLICLCRL